MAELLLKKEVVYKENLAGVSDGVLGRLYRGRKHRLRVNMLKAIFIYEAGHFFTGGL